MGQSLTSMHLPAPAGPRCREVKVRPRSDPAAREGNHLTAEEIRLVAREEYAQLRGVLGSRGASGGDVPDDAGELLGVPRDLRTEVRRVLDEVLGDRV